MHNVILDPKTCLVILHGSHPLDVLLRKRRVNKPHIRPATDFKRGGKLGKTKYFPVAHLAPHGTRLAMDEAESQQSDCRNLKLSQI